MLKDTASGEQENTKTASSCILCVGVTERVWGANSSAMKEK